jgi:hypothetical protein
MQLALTTLMFSLREHQKYIAIHIKVLVEKM